MASLEFYAKSHVNISSCKKKINWNANFFLTPKKKSENNFLKPLVLCKNQIWNQTLPSETFKVYNSHEKMWTFYSKEATWQV